MTDLSAWPALVLAAGLGTRLRPLSLVRAKAALPVGDDVLVRRVLRWLHAAGIRRVVLNLHHQPATITPHVGDGRDLGLDVRYSWEAQVLGSAGGPRRALPLLDAERFLIVNGDTLTDVSLADLTRSHVATGAAVTMTVTAGDPRYGGVIADGAGIVRQFAPAGTTASAMERCHFVGVQAVERRVFETVADNEPSETVRGLYPQLIAQRPDAIRIHRTAAAFHDIGTSADYLATVRALVGNGAHTGRRADVHPTATITGSILWDDVTVGAGAELVDCIVADHVTIPSGARYRRQALVSIDGTVAATAF